MSPKSVITNSLIQSQRGNNYSQSPESVLTLKKSQIQNYSMNS
jgi:hypothetical protein